MILIKMDVNCFRVRKNYMDMKNINIFFLEILNLVNDFELRLCYNLMSQVEFFYYDNLDIIYLFFSFFELKVLVI